MPSQIKINWMVSAGLVISGISLMIGQGEFLGLGIFLIIIGLIGGGNYKWKCDYCNANFNHKADCEAHEKNCSTNQWEYRCKHCNQPFDTKLEALKHLKNCEEREGKWKCDKCGKRFKTKELAEEHEKRHKK